MQAFLQSLPKNSIALIVISSIIGGLIGASFRLIFDVILADQYRDKHKVRQLVDKYRNPIIGSADELRGRLLNILRTTDLTWIETSDYYRLSTYYVVCVYFGWLEILLGKLQKLRFGASRKNYRLNKAVQAVNKTFNNLQYFSIGKYPLEDKLGLPKFFCKAIGEIVISSQNNDEEASCIGFDEFCRRFREDQVFRQWLENLNNFVYGVADEYGNARWDRIQIVILSLTGLINLLDPRQEQSQRFSKADTKNIFNNIHDPFAREVIAADIARYKLPLTVEGRMHWLQRWILLRLSKKPFLREVEQPENLIRQELLVDGSRFEMQDKPGRRKLYEYVAKQAREVTDRVAFGSVEISLVLDLSNIKLHPDILKRIPKNISDGSRLRIRPECIQIIEVNNKYT